MEARDPLRVAVLITTWFAGSHADVIVPRLVEEWMVDGVAQRVDLEVAAVYLEQIGSFEGPDVGLSYLAAHGIPRALSIGEALAAGGSGVNVDGVVIIAEHGDYEFNERGQQLYPRRRFFDAAVAAMVGGGKFVPVFNDKGLGYSARDAREMVEEAGRLGITFGAGSTVPISWRVPQGAQWPLGDPMRSAVLVGWGPLERYGYHCVEALLAHVERRAGGESGVAQVEAFLADEAREVLRSGAVPADLVDLAMDALDLAPDERRRAIDSATGVIDISFVDGLRAHVVFCADEVRQFAVACRGEDPAADFACQMWLQGAPHAHAGFLAHQIGNLVHDRHPRIPIERSQLATAVLDGAMRSWHGAEPVDDQDLAVAYEAAGDVSGTGIDLPRPAGWTRIG